MSREGALVFNNRISATSTLLLLIVVLLLNNPCLSDAAEDAKGQGPGFSAGYLSSDTPADQDALPTPVAPQITSEVYAGYRFISANGYGNRAAEYDHLSSNPVTGVYVSYLGSDHKGSMQGILLNDRDYEGAITYDFKGQYRFKLASQSLYHNLDTELPVFTSFSLNGNSYTPVNTAYTRVYTLTVAEDLAQFRYRPAFFPVHLHMGYWRLTRHGTVPLRFADQAFTGPSNTVFAGARHVDQQTHEGKIGLDTHLGLFDVIYDFRVRQLGGHAPTPRDPFVERLGPSLVMQRYGGLFQHNSHTDNRFYAHTIRVHTSLAGGIVGAGSYTRAKQENLSGHADFSGARQTYTIINNAALDLSYTPSHLISMALKYRRQDVDKTAPVELATVPGIVANPPVAVRAPLDTVKDSLSASLLLRPWKLMTIKGEYKGEFVSRENTDEWVQPGTVATINFPDRSDRHTGSISLLGKPWKGLKLKAQLIYSTTDTPAYADQYEEKQEGTLQVSFNAPNRWGMIAGGRIGKEKSRHLTIQSLDLYNPSQLYQMPRDKKSGSGTVSLWVVPGHGWTVTGTYGLLHGSTDQAVLFVGTAPGSIALTDYTTQAQIYTLNSLYHWNEFLDLSLLLQQVRSQGRFNPGSATTGDAVGVTELTRVKRVESVLAARVDCRLYRNMSVGMEYTFRDYSDKNNYLSIYSGNVNSIIANLAASW